MGIISTITTCNFEGAKGLFFGPNVDPIIYYSHLPIILVSLFLAVFVLFKNKNNLSNKILFYTILAFVIWAVCDSIYWASNRGDVIMFVWAIDVLVESLVYIGALYLLYSLIEKKDMSFKSKVVLGLLYLPFIILVPTNFNLASFDVSSCLAIEGPLALYYSYFVEIIMIISILVFSIVKFRKALNSQVRYEIVSLAVGTILFLFAFSWGNIIGSFTDNWRLGQYGLFGMPVFIGFLAYSITRFKTFNIKLIGANALVLTLCSLIFSLLFINDLNTVRIVIGITFLLSIIFGLLLIRSVRREVSLRESLEIANQNQANLMHFMNHQIKGRFGNARNIFAELLTSDYGNMPEFAKPMLEKGLEETKMGVDYVQNILRGASAENGTLPYDMKGMNMKAVVENVVSKEKEYAEKKSLAFNLTVDSGDYNMTGDEVQLGEAVKNLIDNSINYTKEGSIAVTLFSTDKIIQIKVKDTGIGIAPADKDKLFKSGGRGVDSLKVNVNSTGYGLAFVKGVIEAHKGKVWVESEGTNKGSTFFVELPKG